MDTNKESIEELLDESIYDSKDVLAKFERKGDSFHCGSCGEELPIYSVILHYINCYKPKYKGNKGVGANPI